MSELASELDSRCREAGVDIVGVSIGAADDKTSWTVHPPELQSEAQSIIDAFDVDAYGLEWEWSELRRIRNSKLTDCDWTQIPDAQLTGAQVTAWQTYRQALRDIPENTDEPSLVEWPTLPEE
jgi:hypothetical protein